jgi:hypothetical protein
LFRESWSGSASLCSSATPRRAWPPTVRGVFGGNQKRASFLAIAATMPTIFGRRRRELRSGARGSRSSPGRGRICTLGRSPGPP